MQEFAVNEMTNWLIQLSKFEYALFRGYATYFYGLILYHIKLLILGNPRKQENTSEPYPIEKSNFKSNLS